jgi:hypothetical protein
VPKRVNLDSEPCWHNTGRLIFVGSTGMLCAKRVTDDAPDDNIWLLGERPPILK